MMSYLGFLTAQAKGCQFGRLPGLEFKALKLFIAKAVTSGVGTKKQDSQCPDGISRGQPELHDRSGVHKRQLDSSR